MDQVKIGQFIAQCRKEKKMTQRQLADTLEISDKTVSKWECGRGLPEIQFMMPLCELLGISVNELLSGEKLSADEYRQKAEENMMTLIKGSEYVETYKPLAGWFISLIVIALFFAFEWNLIGNTPLLSRIFIIIIMTLVDMLFAIIYKGEYIYWFVWGPDYETAKNADSQRRKTYAWKYLRIFLIASAILTLYLLGSTLFAPSTGFNYMISLIIFAVAGLATIPIEF